MSDFKFQAGDIVRHFRFKEEFEVKLVDCKEYPVLIFVNGAPSQFTIDGKLWESDDYPTLTLVRRPEPVTDYYEVYYRTSSREDGEIYRSTRLVTSEVDFYEQMGTEYKIIKMVKVDLT